MHKFSDPEATARRGFEGGVALIGCLIIAIFFDRVWKPNRREVFGIASARTIAFYSACVISVPAILIINLRSDFRLGVLFYVPFLLMILAMMSARKESY